jgi:glycosyltransferase involved in cell wall biosynthesis
MEDKKVLKRLFLQTFGTSMLQNAKALIATSQNERKAYLSYDIPKKKIFMMGHGINVQEFFTEKTKDICKKAYRLKKKSFVVSYIGRIHRIKGLDLLVKAIALLKTDLIQVVIAGSDDGFLKELKNLISLHGLNKNIQVYGPCFGQKKSELFKASDLFVYPSYSEGFSLGILEAAGAGLPLLITNGCHFEKVTKWNAGLVVDATPEALARGIGIIIKSNKQRKNFGYNAKKMIETEYAMDKISNKLLNLYDYCRKI